MENENVYGLKFEVYQLCKSYSQSVSLELHIMFKYTRWTKFNATRWRHYTVIYMNIHEVGSNETHHLLLGGLAVYSKYLLV